MRAAQVLRQGSKDKGESKPNPADWRPRGGAAKLADANVESCDPPQKLMILRTDPFSFLNVESCDPPQKLMILRTDPFSFLGS